jgi:hypothetical protein
MARLCPACGVTFSIGFAIPFKAQDEWLDRLHLGPQVRAQIANRNATLAAGVRICALHFAPADVIAGPVKTILRNGALPIDVG